MKRTLLLATLFLLPTVLFGETTQRYMVATRHPFAGRLAPLMQTIEGGADSAIPERNLTAFHIVNGFAADLTAEEAATLRKSPEVTMVYVAPERHAYALPKPATEELRNPNGQTTTYGINLVDAPGAWVAGRGEGINVAVLDTGIDLNHPDLKALIAGGYNTYNKTDVAQDDHYHGTHCAGTIAAIDNGIGVVGVAPNAKLWAVKVLDSKGSGRLDNVLGGIQFVVDKKAAIGGNWIISMSLGSVDSDPLEAAAVAKAIDAGILVVAASGNDSTSTQVAPVGFPAGYPGVVAVGAVDSSSRIADFSNQGAEVLLSAPGVDVLSTVPVGKGVFSVVQNGDQNIDAPALTGSKTGTVTGKFVDCGLGHVGEFPSSVRGNIALIKRGDITFNEKTKNALNAGAIAVVITNKDTSALAFTLISQNCDANGANCVDSPADLAFAWPVTVSISLADGNALRATPNATITVTNIRDDYEILSGTSMACPHVSGAAAVVWSLAPTATAEQIKNALTQTARDKGAAGKDDAYGFGIVDVLAAGKLLAPSKFGTGANPPPDVPPSGRRILRRPH